jgi:hypothetical protein
MSLGLIAETEAGFLRGSTAPITFMAKPTSMRVSASMPVDILRLNSVRNDVVSVYSIRPNISSMTPTSMIPVFMTVNRLISLKHIEMFADNP